ncbi:glycosyltransferase family 4 protein, partial [Candidatus Sumerlaeota bacterium]|nr:glycosyltransferase family 4 protein [Candidatus Sumerlaeota bacterium]
MPQSQVSKPLRVLMLSRSLPCHLSGGLEFHTLDLARGLARAGVEVEILTSPLPGECAADLESNGIRVHQLPAVPPGRYSLGWFRNVGGMIQNLHLNHPYDVIHAQEFSLGFANPRAISPATEWILSVHGTITSETPLHRDIFPKLNLGEKIWACSRFGRRWLYAPWWHRALKASGRIIVDSHFTERELARTHPDLTKKIRIVPLGVEMARYPEHERAAARNELGWKSAAEAELIFLTVGRLEWQKGHAAAIRALADLRSHPRPWRYVIIGDGPEREHLRELTRACGLEHRVGFLGRTDERTKTLALAGADLFLWPEETHPAFGLTGLEAMIMGTPVLGRRRGAIPELIDDQSGWLFDDLQREGMLREILDHPERLESRRAGLRART